MEQATLTTRPPAKRAGAHLLFSLIQTTPSPSSSA